jgi:glutamate racemase
MGEISQVRHIASDRVVKRIHGLQDKKEITDTSYVGMFDSGVGGLTVFQEFTRTLPYENVIYLADTARVPYGGRSANDIIQINKEILSYFDSLGVKMLIMACGTSSAIAYPLLKDKYRFPIVGMIEGGAKMAASATKNRNIGIIATAGTINSGAYEKAIKTIDNKIEVHGVACPLLVPLIEGGFATSDEAGKVLKEYLKPLMEKKIDTLVLGCTHYPHLYGQIRAILGTNVTIVNPAEETVRTAKEILSRGGMLNPLKQTTHNRFLVTAHAASFQELGSKLIARPITEVEEVSVVKAPR